MTISSTSNSTYTHQTQTNKQQSSTNSTFEVHQEEKSEQTDVAIDKEEEEKINYDKLWKLVQDIDSVSRTGFTVEELEYLQKLIAQLQKLISEQEDSSSIEPEIQDKIDEIKKLIIQMQKEVSGEAIINMDDESCPTSHKESALFTLEKLSNIVDKMGSGSEKKDIKSLSTIEELQLGERLREEEKIDQLL